MVGLILNRGCFLPLFQLEVLIVLASLDMNMLPATSLAAKTSMNALLLTATASRSVQTQVGMIRLRPLLLVLIKH